MGREIAEYGEVLTFAGYPEFEAAADRAAGKIKEIEPVMYVLVAVCLLYFYTIV